MANIKNIAITLLLVAIAGLVGFNLQSDESFNPGAFSEIVFNDNNVASNSYSAITTTSTQVLARNAGAIFRRCQNMTGVPVFLSMSDAASKQWGIGLKSSESYEFKVGENLYTGPVHAITISGTARVSCIEATFK